MPKRAWSLCVLLLLLAGPARAYGEGFADLFAGVALTSKGDFDASFEGQRISGEQDYKTSFMGGGRAGWWFGFFGVNLDVAYFRPEPDPDEITISAFDPVLGPFTATTETDLHVVAIGLNGMLRLQFMESPEVPHGRLQPYIFAGPTLFVSTLDVDLSISGPGVVGAGSESDTSTEIGFTAGGGLVYSFTKDIGIFGEYRFTHVRPEFKMSGLKIEPDLNTHHIVAGITFRF